MSAESSEDQASSTKISAREKITDTQAINLIKARFNIKTTSVIRTFEINKRNEAVIFLRNNGLSIRQIERLTGVSRGITQRIITK